MVTMVPMVTIQTKLQGINLSWDTATLGKTRSHKGYAFLEYNVAESAQLALDQMNGVMLGSKPLKVELE